MQRMGALVTGAAHRLGRAMALELGRLGFSVAVHYASSADGAQGTVAALREAGVNAAAVRADLLSEAETQGLVPAAAEALGMPLNVLVNNASIFEYDNIETATRESWDRHMESNLRAPFVLSQAFARQAPPPVQDEGAEPVAQALIVNMVDQRVRKLTPEFMSYTIAKMGLWALTRTSAQALAPAIRVNAIGPGPTLRGHRQSEEHFARQRAATILRRGADADDIVRALRFLVESRSVTGQLICVDGGQHLAWQTPDVLGIE